MKTIRSTKELKTAVKSGEREFYVTDKKMLSALAVIAWIKENPIKGALLVSLLTAGSVAIAPIIGIVGAGVVVGGVTISATEILAVGAIVIALFAIFKGFDEIEVDYPNGRVRVKKTK